MYVLLEEDGVEYEVAGGTLRVVGLAELGQALILSIVLCVLCMVLIRIFNYRRAK